MAWYYNNYTISPMDTIWNDSFWLVKKLGWGWWLNGSEAVSGWRTLIKPFISAASDVLPPLIRGFVFINNGALFVIRISHSSRDYAWLSWLKFRMMLVMLEIQVNNGSIICEVNIKDSKCDTNILSPLMCPQCSIRWVQNVNCSIAHLT